MSQLWCVMWNIRLQSFENPDAVIGKRACNRKTIAFIQVCDSK